jgi:hypothetical protein
MCHSNAIKADVFRRGSDSFDAPVHAMGVGWEERRKPERAVPVITEECKEKWRLFLTKWVP